MIHFKICISSGCNWDGESLCSFFESWWTAGSYEISCTAGFVCWGHWSWPFTL